MILIIYANEIYMNDYLASVKMKVYSAPVTSAYLIII